MPSPKTRHPSSIWYFTHKLISLKSLTHPQVSSERMLALFEKLARSDQTILLLGEPGTGKYVVARRCHDLSRRDGLFVPVNCAGLIPTLIRSELYGHIKGAFSGADADRVGAFELAANGTIFLDEIGDMPLEQQKTLLTELSNRSFSRVGSNKIIQMTARIVAATNQVIVPGSPEAMMRIDFFSRLEGAIFVCTPLRERRQDIPTIARDLVAENGARLGLDLKITSEAIDLLQAQSWPRNVRQLEEVIETAAALQDEGVIDRELIEAAFTLGV